MTPAQTDGAAPYSLSDHEIVRVAQELIAEVGVEGLTMRRLSARLGVALGATYHHVPTKHDLLALVARDLYRQVTLPPPEVDAWDVWLKTVMVNLAELVTSYPGMSGFMIDHIDDAMPLDLNEAMARVLREAGFRPRSIGSVMAALYFFVGGIATGALSASSSRALQGVDVQTLFEDGLDLLLAGARERLIEDRRA